MVSSLMCPLLLNNIDLLTQPNVDLVINYCRFTEYGIKVQLDFNDLFIPSKNIFKGSPWENNPFEEKMKTTN
jgi:hypothetical protein